MDYKIDWIIPKFRKSSLIWKIASCVTVTTIGVLSKLFMRLCNRPKLYNVETLHRAVEERPNKVPLITISNHHSCFDDPALWAIMKWKTLFSPNQMRWSMAAHDICFTNTYHSCFFALGKCIPVVRGRGVLQDAVNYCVEILSKGAWLHVFPEGKVNMTKEFLRFKWGIGRMIYESPIVPIIIPIWHIGMDDVLHNYPPYYLRVGKKVTFNVGDPIDLSDLLNKLRKEKADDEIVRKTITDKLQCEMYKLKEQTEELHMASS